MLGYSVKVAESIKRADEGSLVGRLGRECLARDIPVSRAAAELGCSRQTVYNWLLGVTKPLPHHAAAILMWLESPPAAKL